MVKKFIRKTRYRRKKRRPFKRIIRRAVRRFKKRVFKRRILNFNEQRYISHNSSALALIDANSTSNVSSTFYEVITSNIPAEGTDYESRTGLKYLLQSVKYQIAYCNTIGTTNWVSGWLAMVVVKEKVVGGLKDYAGAETKVQDLFSGTTKNPFMKTMYTPEILKRYSVKIYRRYVGAPSVGTVSVGVDEDIKRSAAWRKTFKFRKPIQLHSSTDPYYVGPKVYWGICYFSNPYSAVSGTPPNVQYNSLCRFKDI